VYFVVLYHIIISHIVVYESLERVVVFLPLNSTLTRYQSLGSEQPPQINRISQGAKRSAFSCLLDSLVFSRSFLLLVESKKQIFNMSSSSMAVASSFSSSISSLTASPPMLLYQPMILSRLLLPLSS
jgi:hypothetical protein